MPDDAATLLANQDVNADGGADPDADPNADVDIDADPATPDDGDGSGDGADPKPFLKVNDRTVYMDEASARQAFNSAGKTIARLTPWEKRFAKRFGINTPEEAAALMEELVARRQGRYKDDSAPKTDARSATDRASATDSANDPYAGLSEAEKKSAQWLESKGWLRKDAVEKMMDAREKKLREEFEGKFSERDEAAEFEAYRQQALPVLNKLLTDNKLPAKLIDRLEHFLLNEFFGKDVDPDDERTDEYLAGGDRQAKILTEGFELFLSEFVNPIRVTQDASAQRDKTNARNKAGAKLPAGGDSKTDKMPKKESHAFGGGISPADHDKAYEAFERALKGD